MNLKKAGPAIVSIVLVLVVLSVCAALAGCGGDDLEPGLEPSGEDATEVVSTAPAGEAPPESPQPTQPDQPETTEVEVVAQAAIAYARANNPSLSELEILEVKLAVEWARVDLQPADRSTDMASALLKKVNGQWTVIDFGLVLPENHPDAPPEVFS